jgi:hypothetical protein
LMDALRKSLERVSTGKKKAAKIATPDAAKADVVKIARAPAKKRARG